MIDLKDIKRVYVTENYPTKWDDLDWTNPDISDPRYLYSIYQAMVERTLKERTMPISRTDRWYIGLHLDQGNFHNGNLFSYRYFEIMYSWVLSTLQDFINPDSVSKAFKFVDGKYPVSSQLLQFSDDDMSSILGYDFRELPKPFQPYSYYAKFLKGMKNAVQAMKWIWWPLIIAGASYGTGYSSGRYTHDDDGYHFTDRKHQ